MWACEKGQLEIVLELIDRGANLEAKDKYGIPLVSSMYFWLFRK